tara:strand:+ start:2975 stop:3331 length:357 start_codon:yes stop_codon:yes gene_type:complete
MLVILLHKYSNAQMTLVRSFEAPLILESKLECNVEVLVWDESYIKCETTIDAKEFPNGKWIVSQLAKVGRYAVIISEGQLIMPKIYKEIWVKDMKLEEEIRVKLHIPMGTSLIFQELL